MLQVTKPYKCHFCKTDIEIFFLNKSFNTIIFVCPTCGKSFELTEEEYLKYIKNNQ